MAGTANLEQADSGTTTLSGTNTYSGTTTLIDGTLAISADNQLDTAPASVTPGSIIFNGGTLNTTTTFTLNANRGIAMTGNGTINVDGSTTLTYNGIIDGAGNLTKSGAGTLVLGGANTYTGATTIANGSPTVTGSLVDSASITVNSGAIYNVASADTISQILGYGTVNLVSSLTLGYGNQAFTFNGSFTGGASLIKTGTASMTLASNSTLTENTVLNASTLILGSADALDAGKLISNSGDLRMASGVTLSSLHVTGAATSSSRLTTTGNQIYDGAVTVTPVDGQVADLINYADASYTPAGVTLTSANGSITFNSTVDAGARKSYSLSVNALNGTVTVGDSVGSVQPLNALNINASRVMLLADVLTNNEQSYKGATTVDNNGTPGFLYSKFVTPTRPVETFKAASPLYIRTLMSMDPMIRFYDAVNPESANTYSLVMAAIYRGFVNGDPVKEPLIILKGLAGNLNPFLSTNFQTLELGNVLALAGKISSPGVTTTATQNYSTDKMIATADASSTIATFRSTGKDYLNFDLSKVGGASNFTSESSVSRVIIDRKTTLTGGVCGVSIGFPVQEAEAAAAAASQSGGNMATVSRFDRQLALNITYGDNSSVSVVMDDNVQEASKEKKMGADCGEEEHHVECK